ncbi:MAG: PepSY-associated TM helix domain-containing protein [Methylococcales bacterium]
MTFSVPFLKRHHVVILHRWVGLLMAVFLILEGLTGSLLAFNQSLEKIINPALFASAPSPDAKPLDLATLAESAELAEPKIRVGYFSISEHQATMRVSPRKDPITAKPYEVGFDQLFLDPWTGKELGHRRWGDISEGRINLMPFVYKLHMSLALGETGGWILGIVALLWTIDSFYAIYLTFPKALNGFFSRWQIAWKVKWTASSYRLNFDLHRASGLWFTPLLLVFAWSSVMFNLSSVYEWTTSHLFDYESEYMVLSEMMNKSPVEYPLLNWHEGLTKSQQAINDLAKKENFNVETTIGAGYIADMGVYTTAFKSDLNLREGGWDGLSLWVDGNTGENRHTFMPVGQKTGNTISMWLRALHFADIHGWLWYRILVCITGIIIALLSGTGIYIWYKKRNARLHQYY